MGGTTFAECRSRADYLRKLIEVENEATPAELHALAGGCVNFPTDAAARLQATLDLMDRCGAPVRPFVHTRLSPGASLYRHGTEVRGKSLLVCFCGVAHRMMVPIPVFLQLIPEDRFDVLVFKDPAGQDYLRGVPDFGGDLRQLAGSIRTRLDPDGYADVRCLGVSSGGAASLYAGLLLGAERAVAIGGRHPTLASRRGGLMDLIGRSTGREFDQAVGDLATRHGTRLLAVFGGDAPRDREGAESLRRHLPACGLLPVEGLSEHNLLVRFVENGKAAGFLHGLLLDALESHRFEALAASC
jgi:hypothetical protein